MKLSLLAVLASTVAAADPQLLLPIEKPAAADPGPQKLGVFAGVGYLAAPGANGSALTLGVRLAAARHVAIAFDLGYGLVTAAPIVHDRWWLIPSVAFVIPLDRVRFDLGVGVGLGTSSGYDNMNDFVAAPFMPKWAFQLVPTVRGHGTATVQLNSTFDGFARLDVASLVLDGNSIGFRDGNPRPGIMDTMWINLSLGVAFRLL